MKKSKYDLLPHKIVKKVNIKLDDYELKKIIISFSHYENEYVFLVQRKSEEYQEFVGMIRLLVDLREKLRQIFARAIPEQSKNWNVLFSTIWNFKATITPEESPLDKFVTKEEYLEHLLFTKLEFYEDLMKFDPVPLFHHLGYLLTIHSDYTFDLEPMKLAAPELKLLDLSLLKNKTEKYKDAKQMKCSDSAIAYFDVSIRPLNLPIDLFDVVLTHWITTYKVDVVN